MTAYHDSQSSSQVKIHSPADLDRHYHADDSAISHSQREVFRESVLLYAGRYVTRIYPEPEPTDEMRLGTAVHECLLRPKWFTEHYRITQKFDKRYKGQKEAEAEYLADAKANGWELVDVATLDKIRRIADGVMANDVARELVTRPGIVEQPIYWTDEATGLKRRGKPDKVFNGRRITIVDMKVTTFAETESFERSMVGRGLLRQAAEYIGGVATCRGVSETEIAFLWIAASTSSPVYECVVHEPHPFDLEQAREEVAADLRELAIRMETGDWSSRYAGINRPATYQARRMA